MMPSIASSASAALLLLASSAVVQAGVSDTNKLVGTWTTKSEKVVTGPKFYNPTADRLIEPELPGVSMSFTEDGHYEEAFYVLNSDPKHPKCTVGILQWQHGEYTVHNNGSLTLKPIADDGRQLLSDECTYDNSIYTRYNQTEIYKAYEVVTDTYRNRDRLNLNEWDGTPMNPMWILYNPPQMLPTKALEAAKTTTGSSSAKSTGSSKIKRSLVEKSAPIAAVERLNADRWFWTGIAMTAVGLAGLVSTWR